MIFSCIVQGLLVTSGAVFTNEILKQRKNISENNKNESNKKN